MTGLEKIVEQIRQEAYAASKESLEKTKKEVEAFLAEEETKREASMAMSIKQADAEASQLVKRGQSAASLQERKLLLEAKQRMIQEIFKDAVDTLLHLDTEKYFERLLHMVDRYALEGDGTIHLSKQDLGRMPEAFLKELEKRNIAVSDTPAIINGGFLLSYGDIEENCTFEALVEAERENLQDEIVRLIF